MAAGIECFRVLFPKGMDANEYASKVTPASQSLALVLRQAQWMGAGKAPPGMETANVDMPDASAAEPVVETREAITTNDATTTGAPIVSEAAEPAPAGPPEAFSPLAAISEEQPPPPSPNAPATAHPAPQLAKDDLTYRFGDRTWRVRGFGKNTAPETLKINVLCMRDAGGFHVDTIELYAARQRAQYAALAAHELGVEEQVIQKDLGQLLLALEARQASALSSKEHAPTERRPLTGPSARRRSPCCATRACSTGFWRTWTAAVRWASERTSLWDTWRPPRASSSSRWRSFCSPRAPRASLRSWMRCWT